MFSSSTSPRLDAGLASAGKADTANLSESSCVARSVVMLHDDLAAARPRNKKRHGYMAENDSGKAGMIRSMELAWMQAAMGLSRAGISRWNETDPGFGEDEAGRCVERSEVG